MIKRNIPIIPRSQDYSEWYHSVIEAAGLAEHAPVKGCMIIKPYGYAIWEGIQGYLDKKFKETGVENAYFPLLIPKRLLEREEDHVEGFAPEVAVVTRAGNEELEEPYVIRPTSETIMYEVFSKWIESYRDLPLLINQWCNVIRWEKRTRLFLRTTEFLWQEGHTVHKTHEEADERAKMMHSIYAKFAEEMMAMPILMGQKTESEKFAGAFATYTCEALMQDGKALQFATSHHLGQNFSKPFNVSFLNEKNEQEFGHQTSWGLSTRSIGGLIMVHSDDKGLVIPPPLAPIQVVILTISKDEESRRVVNEYAALIEKELSALGIRVKIDDTDDRIGEKHFYWEKKGVPFRIEVGPKDAESNSLMVISRIAEGKTKMMKEEIASFSNLLTEFHTELFNRAQNILNEKIKEPQNYDEFKSYIDAGFACRCFWNESAETEKLIKEETGATTRCIPFDKKLSSTGSCIKTGEPGIEIIFAKNY